MVLYAASNMMKLSAIVQLRVYEPEAYRPFLIPLGTLGLCCEYHTPHATSQQYHAQPCRFLLAICSY